MRRNSAIMALILATLLVSTGAQASRAAQSGEATDPGTPNGPSPFMGEQEPVSGAVV